MSSNHFNYGEDTLTYDIALQIANGKINAGISDTQKDIISHSRKNVENALVSNQKIYGVNTGFGALCSTIISKDEVSQLQKNLIKSHAVGVGENIPKIISKLMMILKVHSLCMGYSGVRIELIERILWKMHNDIIPVVPSKGSVGASGDLAPLAHLFLPLIGDGKVYYKNKKIKTSKMLSLENKTPLEIKEKEGLALLNGTQFIAAYSCYALSRFNNCLDTADIIGAMSVESTLSSVVPFNKEISKLRPFQGAQHVSNRVRSLLKNSKILEYHKDCDKVQDPYSIRCIPQVHGASWDAFYHLERMVNIELNSITDNPIVLKDGNIVSGGNFHGQPLAIPIDYNVIAASELGNISDRRIYLLLKGNEKVPKLLVKNTGVNSGFMILQYTTAALASENKNLCYPASADSITTSLGQEDHVSMGSIGAVKFLQVVKNLEKILSIELICSSQAYDFLKPLSSGKKIEDCHKYIRTKISHSNNDKVFINDMKEALKIIKSKKLIELTS
ncbi:MAG: histidine ammonia-lyase [Flammeovirgaceae bacterium]|nr:histidine ammonia-lyase [Flammeovirgaceae bacterium]|tara:strand:+ start:2333 stop:3841 length:1509 start_codon:yes stop_codon:yes gene_type:complete